LYFLDSFKGASQHDPSLGAAVGYLLVRLHADAASVVAHFFRQSLERLTALTNNQTHGIHGEKDGNLV